MRKTHVFTAVIEREGDGYVGRMDRSIWEM